MAIVGAGPTGLMLALELVRHGVRPRVLERATGPRRGSRATDIHSRTLELLEVHGVVRALLARGKTVRRFNAFAAGRCVSRLDFGALDSPYPFTVSLPQRHTETILEEALAAHGVAVERGLSVEGLGGRGRTTLSLRDERGAPTTLRARFCVGADGVGSRVRTALDVPYRGTTYRERYVVADVELDWALPADEVHLFMHREGFLNVIALPGREVRILADRGEGPGPSVPLVRELLSRRTHLPFELRAASLVTEFQIQRRLAARYSVGDVFLAGDAAHTCSPLLGQGMNLGLHDAVALGWRLAKVVNGEAPRALLDEYEAERRPVSRAILFATDLAHRFSRVRPRALCRLRDAAFQLGSSVPALRDACARVTATSGTATQPGRNRARSSGAGIRQSSFLPNSW